MLFSCYLKKHVWIILVLLSLLPAIVSLFKPGYWNMHDDMQMIRQLELEKCLNDGQIPCRWVPDLGYGYGYPLFNFYPSMPYYIGLVFRTFHFSFVWTVKLTAITQFVLAAFFMYLLATSLFGKMGGLISSVFYTYAPYHAVNIYVRGAMNEAWALVFFPLIFYFSRRLILDQKPKEVILLALSYAGLLLSHNPMALTFTPFFAFWCLFWLVTKTKKTNLKNLFSINKFGILMLMLSGIFSVCLTAFFTLPVIFESKFVQIESMFENYYHYSVHFVTFKELFLSNFWGDGPSVWGPYDGMSFSVGFLHWIVPLFTISILFIRIIKHKKIDNSSRLVITLVFLGLLSIFMTHNKSTFIWNAFPLFQKIQFPWRYLSHTTFLLSLAAGYLPVLFSDISLTKYSARLISSLVIITVILINVNHFQPVQSGPLTDDQKFTGKAWTNQITSGIYDYLPKTAKTAAKSPANAYIDSVVPDSKFKIFGEKKGTDWLFFNLSLPKKSIVTISQLAYPGFVITDNNHIVNYHIEPEYGRMSLDLNPGDHQLYIKLQNTPIRTFSNYLSLVAWILVLIYFSKNIWMKLILN